MKRIGLCFIAGILLVVETTGAAGLSGALFPFKENGKWGYMDGTGQLVILPQFHEATSPAASHPSESAKSGAI